MTREEMDRAMARVIAVAEEFEIFDDYAPYSIIVRCADGSAEYHLKRDAGDPADAGDPCIIVVPRDLLWAVLRGQVRLQELFRSGRLTIAGDAAQALIFSHAVAAAREITRSS